MPKAKDLLKLSEDTLTGLATETGQGFVIGTSSIGPIAALSDGTALPLTQSQDFYDAADLYAGLPLPHSRRMQQITSLVPLPSRAEAIKFLLSLKTRHARAYAGVLGTAPLLHTHILTKPTVFCRYLAASTDFRFTTGGLAANTYLSPVVEARHMPTGFSVVGRLALPIPLPPGNVFFYEIGAGAVIEVGTVSPAFGQSGGGVEVRFVSGTCTVQVGPNEIPWW